jgi:hypothetical protein
MLLYYIVYTNVVALTESYQHGSNMITLIVIHIYSETTHKPQNYLKYTLSHNNILYNSTPGA